MPKVDPNDIAKCALHHYHDVLSRGKPRSGDEWTIFAAIVASCSFVRKVVSCATGTKCTTLGPGGWTLRDTHAEVVCRRGLLHVLLEEVASQNLRLLEHTRDNSYQLRPDTTLHLYISTCPCGDASIYPTKREDMNFTGAKVIVSNQNDGTQLGEMLSVHDDSSSTGVCVAREDIQQLGVLRTKSGRSNLPTHLRSTSMSCSDKVLRWCVLGLQGSWFPFEIRLSSIVVSRDENAAFPTAQQESLERAISHRIHQVIQDLQRMDANNELAKRLLNQDVTVHVVEQPFSDGHSSSTSTVNHEEHDSTCTGTKDTEKVEIQNHESKKRKRNATELPNSNKKQKTKSPSGVSLNWQWSNPQTEVVVGARGIRQGKKPKSDQDYKNLTSRLSRASLIGQFLSKDKKQHATSFQAIKAQQAHSSYANNRNLVFQTRPFQDWILGNNDFDI
jgi:tRNA-specific adenosine deaminase 1